MATLGTIGAVKALVYDTVFKRAQEIAASDKLNSAVFEGEHLLKGTAECLGSSPTDVYSLSVSIDGVTAAGECSCPAGKSARSGLCKHAVALLLRRVQQLRKSETVPPESPSEDQLISIASQSDDIATNHDARNATDGSEATQSSTAEITRPPASGSKRALPAWMLGVVGSAAGQAQPSNKPKPSKRAAESKPPRPAPPPPKRARRSGQPLKFAKDPDEEEEEDPGEVCDAGPMEQNPPAPVVKEDVELPETIDLPSEGAAARERRRLRALKKETVAAADDKDIEEAKRTRGRPSKAARKEVSDEEGNDEVKRSRGRSSRAATKEVPDQPLLPPKRRRLSKKHVEDNDDDAKDEAALVNADANIGFGLTDEDLLFLAREQMEKEKAMGKAADLVPNADPEPVEVEKIAENSSQGKKSSSSIFSLNKWKEMSSAGKATGGTLSSAPADLDWEVLKNYSLGVGSQSTSQIDKPSLNPADSSGGALQSVDTDDVAPEFKDVPESMPEATGADGVDAVTNDMLSIFFGSSHREVSTKNVTAASGLPSASHDMPNYCHAEVGLEDPTTSYYVPKTVNEVPTIPASKTDLSDVGVEPKAKKKSSLKDRVKMFLS